MVNKVSKGVGTPIKNKAEKKKLIIGISILAAILILAGVSLVWLRTQNQQSKGNETAPTVTSNPLTSAQAAANAASGTGEGLKAYDEAIQGASGETVVRLYANKAFYALDKNDKQAALAAAKEAVANANGESDQAYFALAASYEVVGEYKNSLENYQKALDAFNKDKDRTNGSSGAFYQQKIDEMKGKV